MRKASAVGHSKHGLAREPGNAHNNHKESVAIGKAPIHDHPRPRHMNNDDDTVILTDEERDRILDDDITETEIHDFEDEE